MIKSAKGLTQSILKEKITMNTLNFSNHKQAQAFYDIVSELGDASLMISKEGIIVMFEIPLHITDNLFWLHDFKGIGVCSFEEVLCIRERKGGQKYYLYQGVKVKKQHEIAQAVYE